MTEERLKLMEETCENIPDNEIKRMRISYVCSRIREQYQWMHPTDADIIRVCKRQHPDNPFLNLLK
jgi:hypothetical protein